MKYSQMIVLALSVINIAAQAEEGIGRDQAVQSFRNTLSPQHNMKNLLGSPKFDSIGTQSSDDDEQSLDDQEAALSRAKPQEAAPTPDLELGKAQTLTGKVVKAEWQKSTASYCQGGSTYYVLVVNDQRYTLNSLRDPIYENNTAEFDKLQAQLAKLEGQQITLTGQPVSRHFSEQEQCLNPMMQCIASALTCDWIRVTNLVAK